MVFLTKTLAETERGIVLRNGRITEIAGPGRHRWFDPLGRVRVDVYDLLAPIAPIELAKLLVRDHPELAEGLVTVVRPASGSLALVRSDGRPLSVVPQNHERAFWTALGEITVETVDLAEADRIDPREAARWATFAGTAIRVATVGTFEAGLLFVDGALRERLAPGRHAFWAADRTVEIKVLDLRASDIEVVAQEILTKDRVSVRLNLTATTRITDPEARVATTPAPEAHVYKLVQLAAREAVAGRTLDALLRDRVEVDRALAAQVRERLGPIGLELAELRIKDVILPGDMREMLNKVVEAEKAAEANLIRRREETAATRSLLNTARLMDDHPTLMRLKELEALERLTEKVGRIDVHQSSEGTGLPALLDTLMGSRKADA